MSYRNKFLINISILLVVMIILVSFVILPALREISNINKEITRQRLELENKLYQGLNIRQAKRDLAEIQESLPELDKTFIKEGQELEFITELENLAANNNVSLNLNPDFAGRDLDNNLKEVLLQISVSGQYHQLLKFLIDLEALPYYYNPNLIIANIKQKNNLPEITFQFNGQGYLLKK